PTLAEFLQFITTEQANKKVIANSFGLKDDARAVDLLSVHKAKGLEFDAVFIVDAVEKDWQPTGNRHGVPANLPLHAPLETEDEYARLMYVAATRAKHTLTFTSYKYNAAGEEVLATPLLQAFPPIDAPRPDTDQSMAILEHALTWPRLETTAEKEVLAPVIENFTINATNLINFLDVTEGGPATFLERSLLRLPQAKSDSMSHGTAVHSALELAQKQVNLGTFDLSAVKAEYRRVLTKEHIPAERLPLQVEQGEKNLDRLFTDFEYQLEKGSQPEQSLKDLNAYDARIGGKLDRIDFVNEETLRIVDYKTGSGLHSLFTKDKNKAVKAWKHKLQLTFYALLARKHPEYSAFKNIEGQMVYVESNDRKFLELSYQPTLEEVEQLEKLIKVVWNHIKNYELPDTSHYDQNMNGVEQFISDLLAEG
ncbi:MAG TPA: PD-(D/E)XK nuclease family protein, partial [Candidatus Saccharibacteria bacterium]|nr:PD-(D/E)XK nuclease family protein [Candidatus Saccharibacteria bacterium]